MPFTPTDLPGVAIFEPKVFGDSRGCFFESYNAKVFKEAGIDTVFVQDNESRSSYGVLRGLHYQVAPYAQAKLVRVVQGKILDVVVDVREGSPHFGRWTSIELSGDNRRQLFVPRGFAHGFVSLSDDVVLLYKCDNFYHPAAEAGIRYDDATLNIDWRIPGKDVCLSSKDEKLPALQHAVKIGCV